MSYSYEDYVAYYKYYYGEQYGTYYAQQAAAAAGVQQVGVAAAAPPPPNSQARFLGTFQITFGSGHSQFLDHKYVKTRELPGVALMNISNGQNYMGNGNTFIC